MPTITTFLTFESRAEEAVALYTSIFSGSKVTRTTRYGEGAPAPAGTVMTIEFELEGQPYVALNGGPYFKFSDGISLSIECDTQAEIDAISAKLIEGGGKQGPCGWVKDRFGVPWQVGAGSLATMLADPDPQKAARVMKAMLEMHKIDIAKLKSAYAG